MGYFIWNGKILDATTPIIGPDNRGLRYGDGVFETLKFKKNQLILLDEHLFRLWKGMKSLQFDIPKLFTPDFVEEQIHSLLRKNKNTNARIRITAIRGNGGLYDPENNTANYLIQSWELPESNGELNENGLRLCVYRDALKAIDLFSNLKHNNYLPYLMGAQFAKKEKCNDAIILNQHHRICDSTIANVFLVSGNKILTPPLSEGCIAGVMAHFLIAELKKRGYTIIEKEITEDELLNADEVFLTNSIYNIRWVNSIGNKTYHNTFIQKIFRELQQTNSAIFC
jgi:branched-chain amino acid aminotransferase